MLAIPESQCATGPSSRMAVLMQASAAARMEAEAWHHAFAGMPMKALVPGELARIGREMGAHGRTVRRKYRMWAEGGRDAAALVDGRSTPRVEKGLTPDFIEWWKGLCQANGRACRPAYDKFVAAYLRGEMIPGIDASLIRCRPLPRGYSYSNLMRHAPTKFELTAARIGRGAAAACRPLVQMTRVGMAVGQRYLFDDLWHDFKVVVVGQRKPCRLLQLHAHDLFSACQFARGMKPRVEDPESGQSVQLGDEEMYFLVAYVLGEFGYHPLGTTLMAELGTARIPLPLEALLADLTGGLVRVERAGREGLAAFAAQYGGRSKGNCRFKGALETIGTPIHNRTADLLEFPGQTGSNSRLNLPEELHGRERALDALERAIVALPGVADQLRKPFLEATLGARLADRVMEALNCRTQHEIEGWLEAGLTTVDYLVEGMPLIPGARVEALPEDKRAAMLAVASPVARRLSPREVFDAGRKELIRLRPELVARLLSDRCGREAKVREDHLIVFEDAAVSPAPLRFLAHHFRPGDVFRVVVNPFDPDSAHLFDARGVWHGTVKAWQRVSRDDTEALSDRVREAAKIEQELLRPLARRGGELLRKRLEDSAHNAATVLAHQGTKDAFDAETLAALRQID